MTTSERIYKFHVKGMHCKSCVLLTEEELKKHELVESVIANLRTCCVEIRGNFGYKSDEAVAQELTPILRKHGYALLVEKPAPALNWSEFKIAVPITLAFVLLYIFLQKIGLVNLVKTDAISYGAAFLIGVIASLSTCLAVVGGLALSVSANFAKGGDKFWPTAFFHVGRLTAFFILGGAIGALGSAFSLGVGGIFAISLIVGVVMIILGFNLLDVFPAFKRWQPSLPKVFSDRTFRLVKLNHQLTPFLLGAATFFLPCGFTQAMQIYTLSIGDFFRGGLVMLIFALGTFPVLALLTFSSFSVRQSKYAGVFFKTAGLVVLLFAIFTLLNAFAILGLIPPIFNF